MDSFQDKQTALAKTNTNRLSRQQTAIKKQYEEMLQGILQDVSGYYTKLEQGGKLTLEEMAKYKRLDSLVKQIESQSRQLTKQRQKALVAYLKESMKYSYEYMAYGIETETLARLGFSQIKGEQILASINNPIRGLTLNETLEKNRKEVVYQLRTRLTQQLVKGSSYRTMATALKDVVENDYRKAITIARTETHRVTEAGKQEAVTRATNQGIVMKKKWNTSRDSRVRKTTQSNHVALDGQTVSSDQPFNLGKGITAMTPGQSGKAEHDINCRCFVTYSVERVEKKTHQELADITFEQWKKDRLK